MTCLSTRRGQSRTKSKARNKTRTKRKEEQVPELVDTRKASTKNPLDEAVLIGNETRG